MINISEKKAVSRRAARVGSWKVLDIRKNGAVRKGNEKQLISRRTSCASFPLKALQSRWSAWPSTG